MLCFIVFLYGNAYIYPLKVADFGNSHIFSRQPKSIPEFYTKFQACFCAYLPYKTHVILCYWSVIIMYANWNVWSGLKNGLFVFARFFAFYGLFACGHVLVCKRLFVEQPATRSWKQASLFSRRSCKRLFAKWTIDKVASCFSWTGLLNYMQPVLLDWFY